MTDEEKQMAYLRKYLEKDKLEEGIALLKKGIPVQYIVGNVDFYGNIIRVDKNVLIPRFETELLVDKTIKRINKYFNNKLIRILELGTGSGCIAISLKKEINSIIDAIDISKEALSVAIDNAKIACINSGYDVENHFPNVGKMVSIGSKTSRRIGDYRLSRYACYLIVQNGDTRKKAIALGQTYFAIQTRKQEINEKEYNELTEDEKRFYQRSLTKKRKLFFKSNC